VAHPALLLLQEVEGAAVLLLLSAAARTADAAAGVPVLLLGVHSQVAYLGSYLAALLLALVHCAPLALLPAVLQVLQSVLLCLLVLNAVRSVLAPSLRSSPAQSHAGWGSQQQQPRCRWECAAARSAY
jgi:hypothetical protein